MEATKKAGVRLIPLINLLGHQSWSKTTHGLLRSHHAFDETPKRYPGNEGIYCRSYCPLHPEVHAVVLDLVDELVEVCEFEGRNSIGSAVHRSFQDHFVRWVLQLRSPMEVQGDRPRHSGQGVQHVIHLFGRHAKLIQLDRPRQHGLIFQHQGNRNQDFDPPVQSCQEELARCTFAAAHSGEDHIRVQCEPHSPPVFCDIAWVGISSEGPVLCIAISGRPLARSDSEIRCRSRCDLPHTCDNGAMESRRCTDKQYLLGTHRAVSPAETLARIRPLLPAMGITRLANVTGLDNVGIPVVMACRPNSRSLSVSQGKGWDLEAAKASAAMEAIEGHHAERVRLPLRLATYEELRACERVVDTDLLMHQPGGCFHPHLPMLWAEGDDWLRQEKVWAPFQLVHSAYTVDMRFDLTGFEASSTGLASGNHWTEAASHAICEVVERDACQRFYRSVEEERESRRIDLDTVDHPQCRELLERCERAGVAVAVWDVTSSIGLAAFDCVIAQRDPDPVRRLYAALGAGCHPARHIAFQRALAEAAQSRLTAISGARDDMPQWEYRRLRDPSVIGRERERTAVRGSRSFAQVPSREAASFEDDLAWELDLLRRAGVERVVVLDLTLPEFGIPVLRVMIPGMQYESGREAGP